MVRDDHQGRGLFTRLTLQAIDELRQVRNMRQAFEKGLFHG